MRREKKEKRKTKPCESFFTKDLTMIEKKDSKEKSEKTF